MNTSTTTKSANPQAVLDMLGKIMALPEGDRAALRDAWRAMDPAAGPDERPAPEGGAFEGDAGVQAGALSAEELAKDVRDWIASLQALPPAEQLDQLEGALNEEEDEAVARQLRQAISALLNSDKKFAAKVALYRYAYEHPILSLLGVLGLVASIVLLAKGVVVRVF